MDRTGYSPVGSRKDIDKRFLMSETVRTLISDWRSSDRINGLSDERKWKSLDNLILELYEDSAMVR
jgi:hypothetical protein